MTSLIDRKIDLIISVIDPAERDFAKQADEVKQFCQERGILFVSLANPRSQQELIEQIKYILLVQYPEIKTPLIRLNCHGTYDSKQKHTFALDTTGKYENPMDPLLHVQTSVLLNQLNTILKDNHKEACVMLLSCKAGTIFTENIDVSNIAILPGNTNKDIAYSSSLDITQCEELTLNNIKKYLQDRLTSHSETMSAQIMFKDSVVMFKTDSNDNPRFKFVREVELLIKLLNQSKEFIQNLFKETSIVGKDRDAIIKQATQIVEEVEDCVMIDEDNNPYAKLKSEQSAIVAYNNIFNLDNFRNTIIQAKNPWKNVTNPMGFKCLPLSWASHKITYGYLSDKIQDCFKDVEYKKFKDLSSLELQMLEQNIYAEQFLHSYPNQCAEITNKYPLEIMQAPPYSIYRSLWRKIKFFEQKLSNSKDCAVQQTLKEKLDELQKQYSDYKPEKEYHAWHAKFQEVYRTNKQNYTKQKAWVIEKKWVPYKLDSLSKEFSQKVKEGSKDVMKWLNSQIELLKSSFSKNEAVIEKINHFTADTAFFYHKELNESWLAEEKQGYNDILDYQKLLAKHCEEMMSGQLKCLDLIE